ncbi:MAG: hypothetical protein D6756_01850, partial [Cyanobacteria bacterium J083]
MNLEAKYLGLGAAVLASGAMLLGATPAQANEINVNFNGEADSAFRAAYSTVSVGGAVNSVAIEVILPDNVYAAGGSYTMGFTWSNSTNPDEAILLNATVSQGTLTESTASGTFEGAVANAINSAVTAGQYENAASIIDKYVGDDGSYVVLD